MLDFSKALLDIKAGKRMRRASWKPGVFVLLVPGVMIIPDQSSPAGKSLGVMAVKLRGGAQALVHASDAIEDGGWEQWLPTQSDLFGNDWEDSDA